MSTVVGRWALDLDGNLGKIDELRLRGRERQYLGVSLRGESWQSQCPHVISRRDSELLDALTKRGQDG